MTLMAGQTSEVITAAWLGDVRYFEFDTMTL